MSASCRSGRSRRSGPFGLRVPQILPADLFAGPGAILDRGGLRREDGIVLRSAVPLPMRFLFRGVSNPRQYNLLPGVNKYKGRPDCVCYGRAKKKLRPCKKVNAPGRLALQTPFRSATFRRSYGLAFTLHVSPSRRHVRKQSGSNSFPIMHSSMKEVLPVA